MRIIQVQTQKEAFKKIFEPGSELRSKIDFVANVKSFLRAETRAYNDLTAQIHDLQKKALEADPATGDLDSAVEYLDQVDELKAKRIEHKRKAADLKKQLEEIEPKHKAELAAQRQKGIEALKQQAAPVYRELASKFAECQRLHFTLMLMHETIKEVEGTAGMITRTDADQVINPGALSPAFFDGQPAYLPPAPLMQKQSVSKPKPQKEETPETKHSRMFKKLWGDSIGSVRSNATNFQMIVRDWKNSRKKDPAKDKAMMKRVNAYNELIKLNNGKPV